MVDARDDHKEFPQSMRRALFDTIDKDGSGKIDLNEYIQWALRESLTKARGKVIDLFRAWDADGSGFIDFSEFSTVLYALGFRCSKRDARNVFDFFDKDGGGEIEYKELNRGLRDGVVARNVKGPAPPTTPKGKGGKGPAPRKKP